MCITLYILQLLSLQGMLARYGPAKYRFSRNYQATGLGFGSNKVSKVSFAFCGARVGGSMLFLILEFSGDQVH